MAIQFVKIPPTDQQTRNREQVDFSGVVQRRHMLADLLIEREQLAVTHRAVISSIQVDIEDGVGRLAVCSL